MVFPRVANRVDRYFGRYLGRLSVYISVAISAEYQSRVGRLFPLKHFKKGFLRLSLLVFVKNLGSISRAMIVGGSYMNGA